jgi:hypothetical protein
LGQAAADVRAFFNEWVWTYDPRLAEPFVRMRLFRRQAEFLTWLEEREAAEEDGLAEKSRDSGLTWLCAGFLVHRWLFRRGFKGGLGSRKQQLVDTIGDPDSIFEKLRIILRRLPPWMLPVGFDWKRDDNFCKLINPASGATITGEAGDDIGRGGRNSIYVVDEAAFVEHPQKIEAALAANTNCRIYVSTPNGVGNVFYQKRHSGEVPVFTMHWHDDPRKNAWELIDADGHILDAGPGGAEASPIPDGCSLRHPWYEAEKKRLASAIIVAQELDIDYTASLEGVTIPAAWVQAAVDLVKRLSLPRSEHVVAGLDVADGGGCENVLTIRRGPVIPEIHSRAEGGTTDTANWALALARAAGVRTLNYDSVGVGAGIAGTFRAKARDGLLGLIAIGVNVGIAPTEAVWPDGRTSKEWFGNLKAELWWIVRRRFEKSFEMIEGVADYPLDEMISIPNHPRLIRELSNVLHFRREDGKIVIETKEHLAKRGVASPDYAESLMLTFAPVRRAVRLAVTGERKIVKQYVPR